MWDELLRQLADFPSAVLSGVDESGYPCSLRCRPEPEAGAQVLRLQLPEAAGLLPGPAGLLCHRHDPSLWNLKSFTLRGVLERDAQGWLFRPLKFVPGAGIGGLPAMIQFVRDGRRSAQHYLDQRGLARPAIDWASIHAIWAEVKQNRLTK